ncbi:MAG: serine/threonine-protein kinase [Cyanobacteriota bacterium]|nr:serine/threonine-protein kinase [Cyanobacteriota bacterium]
MTWKPDTPIQGGKYIIEQKLGSGGFGITYLARQENGDRVAIKTLNDKVRQRRNFEKCQQDFLNEALRLAQCHHPNIVGVHQLVQHDSLWCIVMDYIDGTNLARLVERDGVLSEVQALQYIAQIGDALRVVHDRGFLHRDIKPLNILVRSDLTQVVLIDFGMVRKFTPNLTQEHTEYVSKGFAPIEQYDRRSQRGAFTDVYGLAATLYALVTGEVPESSTLRDRRIAKGERDPLISPKELNEGLSDRICNAIWAGMAIEPEHRPQSVAAWLSLLGVEPPSATVETTPVQNTPAVPISPWSSAVGMDYSRLRDLLVQGKWQEADRETDAILLQVRDRQADGKMTVEDARKFPCRDLRTLDRLWLEHSGGRFGFSVQNRLWRSVEKDYDRFGDRVGWRSGGTWLPYSELKFEATAPEGHLPSWGRRGRLWSFFGSRIRKCGL